MADYLTAADTLSVTGVFLGRTIKTLKP